MVNACDALLRERSRGAVKLDNEGVRSFAVSFFLSLLSQVGSLKEGIPLFPVGYV